MNRVSSRLFCVALAFCLALQPAAWGRIETQSLRTFLVSFEQEALAQRTWASHPWQLLRHVAIPPNMWPRRSVIIAAGASLAGAWLLRDQQNYRPAEIPAPAEPKAPRTIVHVGEDSIYYLSERRGNRGIAYREMGSPSSKTHIVLYHGLFDSRLPLAFFMNLACIVLGIHMIIPDRPGVGLSTPHPYRTIRDWTEDMTEFIPAVLKGADFSLVGYSAGGRYAHDSLAADIPGLKKVMLVSSVGPLLSKTEWLNYSPGWILPLLLARFFPKLSTRLFFGKIDLITNHWPAYFGRDKGGMIANSLPADQRVLGIEEMSELMRKERQASVEQDAKSGRATELVGELRALAGDARIDPSKAHRLLIYHGNDDSAVPMAAFNDHVAVMKGAIALSFPGMGHHMVRILLPYFLAQLKRFHAGLSAAANPLDVQFGARELGVWLDSVLRRYFQTQIAGRGVNLLDQAA